MAFIRNYITQRRRDDLETLEADSGRIECMAIEIMIKSEKWLLVSVYKQPKVNNCNFKCAIESLFDKLSHERCNYIISGDFNVNILTKANVLEDVFDLYGVKNVVLKPTCFKSKNMSIIDLVVTNVPKRLQNTCCIDTGLSDCHYMVCFSTKIHVPIRRNKSIVYRSYKHFNESEYVQDLSNAPFHVAEIHVAEMFDCVDDAYGFVKN